MQLSSLTPTERISLVGGQLYAAFQKMNEYNNDSTRRGKKEVDTFLAQVRDDLNRIIDLIEESNPNGDGTNGT